MALLGGPATIVWSIRSVVSVLQRRLLDLRCTLAPDVHNFFSASNFLVRAPVVGSWNTAWL